jgi:alcohol dehydrogenase (cytochrome c)
MRPLLFGLLAAASLAGQVTYNRLLQAAREPQNWLTYSGTYASQRHSTLDQITPKNVGALELKWIFQLESLQRFQATPLVVDGVMYLTQPPNDVVALDARTGRVFWIFNHRVPSDITTCCGLVNRGLAILGDRLFMATVDAHLVAIDAKNGKPLWKTRVADPALRYSMTLAPLVVKDKVIVGVAGGEWGIRGFVAAYDAKTGKEAWRFNTIPGPGEFGHDTWPSGDAWTHGGGPVWVTGSYDAELNLTYWGTGNPAPLMNSAQRQGDNLFTDSVVALDADTGKRKWHFQFTPADRYDYDSVQVPVLVDTQWNGAPRKLMLFANRNGFFYVLDRATGQFLSGRPFVKLNWASGLDDAGRPKFTPQSPDALTYPGIQGATNWYSPSYSPRTGLFYISAWLDYASMFAPRRATYKPGHAFLGGVAKSAVPGSLSPGLETSPLSVKTELEARGAVLAFDFRTGERKWEFKMHEVTDAGILTTASDLLFTGGREGYFLALDARTGALLWKGSVGGTIAAAPITYAMEGKQYVAIAAGHALFVYGLKD